MSGVEVASAEAEAEAPGGGTVDAPALRLRFDTGGVTDVEVAAVTAAVLALTPPAGPPTEVPDPAWRRAGLREATGGVRSTAPWQLEG